MWNGEERYEMKSNERVVYAYYLRVLSTIAVILTHITGTVLLTTLIIKNGGG